MNIISRNQPCPCGSGKKYKLCCSAKQPAAIGAILDTEVFHLQQDILNFAIANYEHRIDNIIENILMHCQIEDEEQLNKAGLFIMLWTIFTLPFFENDKTILENYISKNYKKIKRPALKDAILTWQEATPSIYKVKEDHNSSLVIKNIFTNEEKQVFIENIKKVEEVEEKIDGHYVLGLVIEYQNRASFFTTYHLINDEQTVENIINFYNAEANDYPANNFVKRYFSDIVKFIFTTPQINIEEIDWETKEQKQVIELVINHLNLPIDMKKPIEGVAIALWKSYCDQTGAKFRNIANYAAALHYIVGYFYMFFGVDEPSKQEITQTYDVKMRSLTTTVNKLKDVLDEEISELIDNVMYGFEEDFEDEGYDDLFDDEDEWYDEDAEEDEDDFDLENLFQESDYKINDNESGKHKNSPIVDELALRRKAKKKTK